MAETFEKLTITIDKATLGKIRRLGPADQAPGDAVLAALSYFINNLDKVQVSRDTLASISERAGVDPIRSEVELVRAFESATHLRRDSFVVSIDPVMLPMIEEVAKGQGRTVAEVMRDYISHSAANGGFFTDHMPYRYVNLTNGQWNRLWEELGSPKYRDAETLVSSVVKLKAELKTAEGLLEEASKPAELVSTAGQKNDAAV